MKKINAIIVQMYYCKSENSPLNLPKRIRKRSKKGSPEDVGASTELKAKSNFIQVRSNDLTTKIDYTSPFWLHR